ncbi:MAG: CoA transferase [Pseudomonadales bacterium]|nr:CoA transferase [Pseudomonadales bacterium]
MTKVDFSESPTGPLSGVRVVDFTAVYSGPLAASILGDQGADVIKIEPHAGDLMRRGLPKQGGMASAYFTLNRNKRAVCVDLQTEAGLKIVKELIATADAVMENFRPGVMERLGLGYEQFQATHPKLVYASINGVGPTGPYSKRRVYDAVIQAISGFASLRPDGTPELVNSLVCDKITSLTAAEAVVAALYQAERSGVGQKVEVSMLDANLFFLWSDVMNNFTYRGEDTEKMPYADLSLFIRKTSDGYVAAMPVQQPEVEGALRALELEDLIEDERFTDFEARARNRAVMKELTDVAYARFTTAEISARLERNDVPWSMVNLRHEVIDDPQITAMGALVEYDHPVVGPVRQPRPAAQFGRTPSNMHQPTAFLGEHNSEVLTELGYSDTEIASLVEQKVLHAEMK